MEKVVGGKTYRAEAHYRSQSSTAGRSGGGFVGSVLVRESEFWPWKWSIVIACQSVWDNREDAREEAWFEFGRLRAGLERDGTQSTGATMGPAADRPELPGPAESGVDGENPERAEDWETCRQVTLYVSFAKKLLGLELTTASKKRVILALSPAEGYRLGADMVETAIRCGHRPEVEA